MSIQFVGQLFPVPFGGHFEIDMLLNNVQVYTSGEGAS